MNSNDRDDMSTFVEEEILTEKQTTVTELYDLIVFNDDVNTFDHVISCLIDICGHEPHQAEQCTWIIHYRGKCAVKRGDMDELTPMRNAICNRGISAEVL